MTIFFSTKLGEKARGKNLKVRPTTTSWLFSFSFLFVNQTTKKKISSPSSLLVSFFLLPLSLFFAKHSVGLNVPKPPPMSSFMSLLVFLFYFEISNFLYLHSYKTFYFLFFYNHIKLVRWIKSIRHIYNHLHHLNFKLMYNSITTCDSFFFSSIVQ